MELVELAKTAMSIKKLLDGDAFSTALDAIAGVDIKTAKYAIKNHTKYANPQEALNTALGNLIHAHSALEEKYSRWRVKLTQGSMITYSLETDAYVCCLIAILHIKLGNSKELIKETVGWAEKVLFRALDPLLQGGGFEALNPIFWYKMFTYNIDSDDIRKCIRFIQEQEGIKSNINWLAPRFSKDYPPEL